MNLNIEIINFNTVKCVWKYTLYGSMGDKYDDDEGIINII
jgi:hypothetical protein